MVSPADQPRLQDSCEVSRVARKDESRVQQFCASPGVHYICLGACSSHHDPAGAFFGPAAAAGDIVLVATSPPGDLSGFAGVRRKESPCEDIGELTLLLRAGHHRDETTVALLRAAARDARAAGMRRLETQLCRETGHTLEEFRRAGLHALSTLNLGGVTEVALEIDAFDS
ncbi:MAG: hypothetical protein HY875_07785 [Chloroflexi bacterium]|nr:hypothetical protein [Chloroflexota bacterium]